MYFMSSLSKSSAVGAAAFIFLSIFLPPLLNLKFEELYCQKHKLDVPVLLETTLILLTFMGFSMRVLSPNRWDIDTKAFE